MASASPLSLRFFSMHEVLIDEVTDSMYPRRRSLSLAPSLRGAVKGGGSILDPHIRHISTA